MYLSLEDQGQSL